MAKILNVWHTRDEKENGKIVRYDFEAKIEGSECCLILFGIDSQKKRISMGSKYFNELEGQTQKELFVIAKQLV